MNFEKVTFSCSKLLPYRRPQIEEPAKVLFSERCKDCPHDVTGVRPHGLRLEVEVEERAHAPRGQLVVFVGERRECVLEHVGRVRQHQQRQGALVRVRHVRDRAPQSCFLHLRLVHHDSIKQGVAFWK